MAQLHSSTIRLVKKYLFWSALELNFFFISFDNLEILHQKIMSSHSLHSAMLFVSVIGILYFLCWSLILFKSLSA